MKPYYSLLFVFCSLFFVACDQDEAVAPRKFVDASNYSNWTYVNLETGQTETHRDFTDWVSFKIDDKMHPIEKLEDIPSQGSPSDVKIKWHVAFRRERTKTNQGAVLMTSSTQYDQVDAKDAVGDFRKDTPVSTNHRLMIDQSRMMEGILTYSVDGTENEALNTWVQKTGRPMIDLKYTPTQKVFLIKTKDNELFKLQITDFLDDKGVKGFLTIKSKKIK